MNNFPFSALLSAVYDRLTGADAATDAEGTPLALLTSAGDSMPVQYAGTAPSTGGTAAAEYVALEIPRSNDRSTLTSRGAETLFLVRLHTEYTVGGHQPLTVFDTAAQIDHVLRAAPLTVAAEPDGRRHVILHWPEPAVTPNQYRIDDARRAHDVVMRYTVKTQLVDAPAGGEES